MPLNDWLPSKDVKELAKAFTTLMLVIILIITPIAYYPILLWGIPIIFVVILLWAILAPAKVDNE